MGFKQLAGKKRRRRQVVHLAGDQRKGKRRPIQKTPFKCRRHSARIQYIITQVGTQVDARHHHVRLLLEQAVNSQVHAIGRCTVDADKAIGQGMRMQGTVQRQRTAGATFVLLGGNYHALGVVGQRTIKRGQARSCYPVIV